MTELEILEELKKIGLDKIEEYETGNLKGELKDIASKLKYDDNDVYIICKLK